MEGREPLGDHTLEVRLGEPRERGEVAVQEAQTVVVVLEVQAPAHALGQLIDEAELAVVVARPDAIEHGRLDLDAERLSGPFGHRQSDLDAAPEHVELDVGLVGGVLPFDHVAGSQTVDARDLVTGLEPGERRG